jgi:hypothetical protein
MSLLRMKKTAVSSWRELIACCTMCILYRPLELLISKGRKHFLPQSITEEGKGFGMTSGAFSSFPKTLNRICSKVQSMEHFKPYGLENFYIQKKERSWCDRYSQEIFMTTKNIFIIVVYE